MKTVGLDLAAEPERTAVATIHWSDHSAEVTSLVLGVDDLCALGYLGSADKVGIDCPFGWPVPFIDFLDSHRNGHVRVPHNLHGLAWRKTLAFRETDAVVRATTGLIPLSVAADRIGHTAMRCAGLLAALAAQGNPVDRTGSGSVVEVYPAAALRHWALPHKGYKRPANLTSLGVLVDQLGERMPWLHLGAHEALCRRSDDALDAVVCALVARAVVLGRVQQPDARQLKRARTEGWIAVPTCAPADLVGGPA